MDVKSPDYGLFTNFIPQSKSNPKIKKGQILGAICYFSACDPIISPMNGYITTFFDLSVSKGYVDPGDKLYRISDSIQNPNV